VVRFRFVTFDALYLNKIGHRVVLGLPPSSNLNCNIGRLGANAAGFDQGNGDGDRSSGTASQRLTGAQPLVYRVYFTPEHNPGIDGSAADALAFGPLPTSGPAEGEVRPGSSPGLNH
jgi:hypothetical protein